MVFSATDIGEDSRSKAYPKFRMPLACEALDLLLGEVTKVVIFSILSLWGRTARSGYDHFLLKILCKWQNGQPKPELSSVEKKLKFRQLVMTC